MTKKRFLLTVSVAILVSSCVKRSITPERAYCVNSFTANVEFCNSKRPLSDKVQDGSLVKVITKSGKTFKVAVYYSPNYSFCLPKTYRKLVREGERVEVQTLRCGYSKNKPYCPWVVKVGLASWYGYNDGSGKYTASGRPFIPESYGLANKELPFGTLVKITNLDNGKSVEAVVLDRGPYVKGRDFDLYPKTMRSLGGIRRGVIPVKVEVLRCGWPVE